MANKLTPIQAFQDKEIAWQIAWRKDNWEELTKGWSEKDWESFEGMHNTDWMQ